MARLVAWLRHEDSKDLVQARERLAEIARRRAELERYRRIMQRRGNGQR